MNHPKKRESKELDDYGDDVAALLLEIQLELRAYIGCLLGAPSDLGDVLQEVNIFILERRSEYALNTNFKAWAFKIAYFKALAARRDHARRKKLIFNDELLVELAESLEDRQLGVTELGEALEDCLMALDLEQRQVIDQHYFKGMSVADIAHRQKKKVMAVYKSISRIRTALRRCIERKISGCRTGVAGGSYKNS